jgi:hypothetical protein
MEKKKSVFERLSAINVNGHVEKKKDLTYLSWPWAWAEVKRECPDARYVIKETEFDEILGFMCHTEVTIEGETLEMWLPVMDGANKSMLKKPYSYKTKYGDKTVEAATSFDVNKTIMRCLVKNLAMFGLGLYIYAGEDLPDTNDTDKPSAKTKPIDEVEEILLTKDEETELINSLNACTEIGHVKELWNNLDPKYQAIKQVKKLVTNRKNQLL